MMAPAADNGVVLITGASSGLGEAFARAYAARGRDLIVVARRLDRLEALSAELHEAHGVRSLPLQIDLSVLGAESEVLQAVAAHGQTVDVLVNNAGFSIPQSFAAV